ncbi:MAG: type II toxin-antitoxin system Phd/YefM family antitoxin [Acidobacteriota bacterium]
METVSVKELKAHLSEYLRRAGGGEHIVVTQRGREIAEIGPLPETRQALRSLQAQGRIQWSGAKPAGLRGIRPRGAPVSDTVIEDRR